MIELRYKCVCMNAEASLLVRFRKEEEDIIAWMDNCVRPALGQHHMGRSPLCRANAVEFLKIPAPENAPFVGGKPVLNS
jgi:hypothetical protein